jgi:hypothetical protein
MTSADLSELPALWWENTKKDRTLNVVICAFEHVHDTWRCDYTHAAKSVPCNIACNDFTIYYLILGSCLSFT